VIVPPSRMAAVTTALTGRSGAITAGDRLIVIEPLAAKGLEYDAVVVVAPDEIVTESPGGERVLYVALTRPTQRLVVADLGTSHWLEGLEP
ncbi:MAG: ATP-binding domain-containing protein, partial [Propionibacteriaceae bacterium]|nr:ATP-binding domain-containing protein [Propionibacteriaceae bacterium]